jgi:hypothetical protein
LKAQGLFSTLSSRRCLRADASARHLRARRARRRLAGAGRTGTASAAPGCVPPATAHHAAS